MSVPRQILPGGIYMITRRCTQRQFLLRLDDDTNQSIEYCLAEAAQRFGIQIILPSWLSNHHHTLVYDPNGTISQFVEHLHKFTAKSINCLRGRWENLWSCEPVCQVRLEEPADVIDKLVYAATNPVKDHLVERVEHWPGVNGLADLLEGRSRVVRRPRHFFRADGPMPESVTLELTLPAALGDPDEVRRQIRERVAAVEQEAAAARRRAGKTVLGRRAVLRQSWRSQPASSAPRRGGLRPRVAARSKWARIEALLRNRVFLASYREAYTRWRAGLPAVFPAGTYWLRRFANVTVAPFVSN